DTDFGQEAIETLLKRMEDNRDRFVVIIAGYTDEMKNFIQSNPGLKSRFNTYLHFNDYNAEELMDIYRRLFIKAEHQLSSDADEFSMKYFQFLMRSKDKYFGNARDIRNLLEDIIKIQSSRLAQVTDISDEQLRTVNKEDVQLAVKDNYEEEHEITLEDVLQELNNLVGLTEIKKEVSNLTDFIKVEQMRKLKGLPSKPISLHSVFYGPPGTGKTTVARLLGKIFKTLRLLPKGEVKEVSRADLVAEYIGQTAIKTNKVIDDAFNGVLFLDEAYSLSDNKTGSDFGKEAIETLLKRMEDDRSHLCVIIAGYTDKMKQFIDSNPGLRSRFTNYFFFENYSADELLKIIIGFMESEKYILEPGGESLLTQQFENWIYTADENFGNARDARNLFEKIKVQQSKRLNRMENPSTDDLSLLKKVDIQASTDNDKTF
ncbi:MAG: AAA family ATPase, partial [Ignavibacteria bacterium]|nr:AAA family ATPase [Ignavibacteria bacterium]